ncbi:L-lysine 2-3-aminomutase [Penicillium rubens]|uniref:L-lysine 2-3-aminomutase n=1 Tax=Penicillium rubens TaxID=1108849 RepID=UPI002A59DA1E|nr:L-lysine 2-3-aminomutase [Penicillium rubens]KAJ5831164.1 L-lysine 2-3-aminomutase [Penicillium rubens]
MRESSARHTGVRQVTRSCGLVLANLIGKRSIDPNPSIILFHEEHDTYDHRVWKTGLPVRSAVLKPHAGELVVGWVTTSESSLLVWKTGLPVRSAVLKPHAGELVVGWVTTSESSLLGTSRLDLSACHNAITE